MIWLKEIKVVGLRDWLWFVVKFQRNEFHKKLDMCNWSGTPIELMRTRQRAHDIDDKITYVRLMEEIKEQ